MNPEAKIMLDHCASLGITQGRMLDLGAGDAVGDASVALPFIDRGWDVTLVDASPTVVSGLARKFGRHPKVKVVQALLASVGGDFAPFYEIPGDTALSTACAALMKRKIGREEFDTVHMMAATWEDLVLTTDVLDVVSVDLEGHSMAVAMGLMRAMIENLKPSVLCVEVFPREVLGMDEAEDLASDARANGYKVLARTKENLILVRA